jgi:hypothetical protein
MRVGGSLCSILSPRDAVKSRDPGRKPENTGSNRKSLEEIKSSGAVTEAKTKGLKMYVSIFLVVMFFVVMTGLVWPSKEEREDASIQSEGYEEELVHDEE